MKFGDNLVYTSSIHFYHDFFLGNVTRKTEKRLEPTNIVYTTQKGGNIARMGNVGGGKSKHRGTL